jgi:hypothetical protein
MEGRQRCYRLLALCLAACCGTAAAATDATDDGDPVGRFATAMMRDLAVESMDCATRQITVGESGAASRVDGTELPDIEGLRSRGMRALCGYRLHIEPDRFRSLWEGWLASAERGAALPEGPWEPLGAGLSGRAYRLDEALFTVGISSLRGQGRDASLSGVVLIFLFADGGGGTSPPRSTAPQASR